jgi:hypothetical protein
VITDKEISSEAMRKLEQAGISLTMV